jgi:hypothetical protein
VQPIQLINPEGVILADIDVSELDPVTIASPTGDVDAQGRAGYTMRFVAMVSSRLRLTEAAAREIGAGKAPAAVFTDFRVSDGTNTGEPFTMAWGTYLGHANGEPVIDLFIATPSNAPDLELVQKLVRGAKNNAQPKPPA